MLNAGERTAIAYAPQGMQQMALVIMQSKPEMSKTKHATLVGILTRQQRRTGRRTGRADTERLVELHSFRGQVRQRWRPKWGPIGFHPTTSVVTMQIEDIGMFI